MTENPLPTNHFKRILGNLKLEPCVPPFWARGGHGQTLWGHLLPSPAVQAEGLRRVLELPDGDRLVGYYYPGRERVMLYVFHGLGGHASSAYVRRTINLGLARGYSVLAMNHRGCGAGVGLAAGPYHSGRAEDLSTAFAFGRDLHPDHLHIGVGFSLSGNALLLLLSGKRGTVLPDAAIAVNAPIRLDHAAQNVSLGLNRLYDIRFVLKCRAAVKERFEAGLIKTRYHVPRLATLQDVDHIYTAPEGGFLDPQDYYDQCSTAGLLDRIEVPTVLLTAADDPMVDVRDYEQAELSPSVFLYIEPHGGHMGYLSGKKTPLGSKRWQDYAIDSYLGVISALKSE